MNRTTRIKEYIPLMLTMLLSAFLNSYGIWKDETANTYYTTAVASMLRSFHNFFFGALDPGGFVTVDKPPLTFWIQTISAKIFGLYGWSVILPQALAGIGSVWLLYGLIRPTFGRAAARIGALALACTPIAVAVSRTNNIDSMLVFTLLLGATLLFRGVRRDSIWPVLGAFAIVGVAFNMKMMQAYMVVPAFGLFYLIAAKANWKKKLGLLTASAVLMVSISLSWAVAVDSIPQNERPYIGSSETNSVLELALGYNGVSRLTGDKGPGGASDGQRQAKDSAAGVQAGGVSDAMAAGTDSGQADAAVNATGGTLTLSAGADQDAAGPAGGSTAADGSGFAPGQGQQLPGMNGGAFGQGGPGGGEGGAFGTGQKGPLRLFQSALSGQASWLIPFAAFASIALLAGWRRKQTTMKRKETMFWLAWLIPAMVFFSIAGFFHHYYLIMLAAPIAALTGAGWAELWDAYRTRAGWRGWLLPVAVAATAAFEWYIVQPYDSTIGQGWSIGIAAGGGLAALLLAVWKARETKAASALAVAGLLALLVGPLYWAATPITYGMNSMLPQAGPGGSSFGGPGMNGGMPGGGNAGAPGSAADGRNGWGDGRQAEAGGQAAADGSRSQGAGNAAEGGQISGGVNADGTGERADTRNGAQASQGAASEGAGDGRVGGMDGAQDGRSRNDGAGMGQRSLTVDETTLAYLREHNTGETFLFATFDYNTAAPYIIKSGESVITMGGFSGSDPVFTVERLKTLVSEGKVKYFMISGGGMGGGRGGSSELNEWIKEHGTVVPTSEWRSNSGSDTAFGGPDGRSGGMTLYEVKLEG